MTLTPSQLKYSLSDKGKQARLRYQQSDKARETRKNYQLKRKAKLAEAKLPKETTQVNKKADENKIRE